MINAVLLTVSMICGQIRIKILIDFKLEVLLAQSMTKKKRLRVMRIKKMILRMKMKKDFRL